MRGRYQRRSDKQMIAEAFAISNVDGLHLEHPVLQRGPADDAARHRVG
jgi:hypothetical protein